MKTKQAAIVALQNALENLTARFPLEGFAQNGECKCLQYEDHGHCRHLQAVETLEESRKFTQEKNHVER